MLFIEWLFCFLCLCVWRRGAPRRTCIRTASGLYIIKLLYNIVTVYLYYIC